MRRPVGATCRKAYGGGRALQMSVTALPHVSPAFSLLVVDECHHTHKDTVYNIILSRYLEHKLQRTQPLPQVLGLTASPGTGGASTLNGAIDHILQVSWAPVTPPPPPPAPPAPRPAPRPAALPRLSQALNSSLHWLLTELRLG